MGSLSWWEILLIAGLVILLFGARRLPELGKNLAEGIRSFRKGLKDQPPESGGTATSKDETPKPGAETGSTIHLRPPRSRRRALYDTSSNAMPR